MSDELRFKRLEEDVEKLKEAIFIGDGPDKPSLIAVSLLTNQKIDQVRETIENLVPRIAAIVAILGGIVALLIFLGPSLRHAVGLPVTSAPTPPQPQTRLVQPKLDAGNPPY